MENKMRKLKLQMHITIDGFVGGPNGELDWMTNGEQDDKFMEHVNSIADASDTILMGRKMTDEFVKYWTGALEHSESPEYALAQKMVDYPKVVFTKMLDESPWPNTVLAKGDIVEEVNSRKKQEGKDIVAYGGAGFVSSLIKHNLIDEYHFLVHPVAIGRGMTIFGDLGSALQLKQVDATLYACGITIHKYLPGSTT
jgi:dihydrofolate reductase